MPTHPKKLLSKLMAFDHAHALVARGDRILIAVSGGPDSVCLAHHLRRLSRARGLRLALMHVHHGLRGKDADRDARFVRELALKLGLPLYLRKASVTELAARQRRSLEDAGRILRYRALARAAKLLGFNKAATGHQLDDQAETFILHLLRGTKAKGLAGIPAKRKLKEGVTLIRPLLPLSRAEVLEYLKAYRLRYRTDRTNRAARFTRNWVRGRVLPLLERRNPRIREHLAAIAEEVRRLLEDKSR